MLTDVRLVTGGIRFELYGHNIDFSVDDRVYQLPVPAFRRGPDLAHDHRPRVVLVQSLWRINFGFPRTAD